MDDELKRLGLELAEGRVRLNERDQRLVHRVLARGSEVRDASLAYAEAMSFGERLSDRVAAIGGSWAFVSGFGVVLACWTALNMVLPGGQRFDPYPFIFLNLLLSMLAAIQAPIIMMSQNRQAAKDRLSAQLDYEVNVKAEAEVAQLHEKLDRISRQLAKET